MEFPFNVNALMPDIINVWTAETLRNRISVRGRSFVDVAVTVVLFGICFNFKSSVCQPIARSCFSCI